MQFLDVYLETLKCKKKMWEKFINIINDFHSLHRHEKNIKIINTC